jgi:hypothetical protein
MFSSSHLPKYSLARKSSNALLVLPAILSSYIANPYRSWFVSLRHVLILWTLNNNLEKAHTWTMHPPRLIPSKNWWNVSAATSGLMVLGLSDVPRDIPMITECTMIPSSRTYWDIRHNTGLSANMSLNAICIVVRNVLYYSYMNSRPPPTWGLTRPMGCHRRWRLDFSRVFLRRRPWRSDCSRLSRGLSLYICN